MELRKSGEKKSFWWDGPEWLGDSTNWPEQVTFAKSEGTENEKKI